MGGARLCDRTRQPANAQISLNGIDETSRSLVAARPNHGVKQI